MKRGRPYSALRRTHDNVGVVAVAEEIGVSEIVGQTRRTAVDYRI